VPQTDYIYIHGYPPHSFTNLFDLLWHERREGKERGVLTQDAQETTGR